MSRQRLDAQNVVELGVAIWFLGFAVRTLWIAIEVARQDMRQ